MSENTIYVLLGIGLFVLTIGVAFGMQFAKLNPADRKEILKELRNGLRTKLRQKLWPSNTKKEN